MSSILQRFLAAQKKDHTHHREKPNISDKKYDTVGIDNKKEKTHRRKVRSEYEINDNNNNIPTDEQFIDIHTRTRSLGAIMTPPGTTFLENTTTTTSQPNIPSSYQSILSTSISNSTQKRNSLTTTQSDSLCGNGVLENTLNSSFSSTMNLSEDVSLVGVNSLRNGDQSSAFLFSSSTADSSLIFAPPSLSASSSSFCIFNPLHTTRCCLDDVYQRGEVLGRGTFATVYAGIARKTSASVLEGEEVAIKVISKNHVDVQVESLRTEVKILKNITHEHIVPLKDVFEDDDHVYVIMQQMKGGELFEKIIRDYPNGYSEARASEIIRQLLDAIQYLHGVGIIHRDIKPENVLFEDNEKDAPVKLTDFGLAKIWSGDLYVRSACGSPYYVAPEILMRDSTLKDRKNILHNAEYEEEEEVVNNHTTEYGYTFAVDLWALGVLTYALLCGFCPFYDENVATLFHSIQTAQYTFPSPYWDTISNEAKDFISKLLILNVEERMDAASALRHPWILQQQQQQQEQMSDPILVDTNNNTLFPFLPSSASTTPTTTTTSSHYHKVIPKISENLRHFRPERMSLSVMSALRWEEEKEVMDDTENEIEIFPFDLERRTTTYEHK